VIDPKDPAQERAVVHKRRSPLVGRKVFSLSGDKSPHRVKNLEAAAIFGWGSGSREKRGEKNAAR